MSASEHSDYNSYIHTHTKTVAQFVLSLRRKMLALGLVWKEVPVLCFIGSALVQHLSVCSEPVLHSSQQLVSFQSLKLLADVFYTEELQ